MIFFFLFFFFFFLVGGSIDGPTQFYLVTIDGKPYKGETHYLKEWSTLLEISYKK